MEIYIVCNHDRHTDDRYFAYHTEEAAKNKARELMAHWKEQPGVDNQYGDWCIYISDDYYCMVQKVDLL
jgi:hypothetical protein